MNSHISVVIGTRTWLFEPQVFSRFEEKVLSWQEQAHDRTDPESYLRRLEGVLAAELERLSGSWKDTIITETRWNEVVGNPGALEDLVGTAQKPDGDGKYGRDVWGGVIGGVCAGVGRGIGINPLFFRLGVVMCGVVFPALTLLVYPLCAWILPRRPKPALLKAKRETDLWWLTVVFFAIGAYLVVVDESLFGAQEALRRLVE